MDVEKKENTPEQTRFVSPGIGLSEPPEYFCGIDSFYRSLLEKKDKTELDKLNLFLLQLGGKDRIGYRKKLVIIKKYLKSVGVLLDNQ